MSIDDYALFQKEMQDVTPIRSTTKANIQKRQTSTPGQLIRRAAAQEDLADPNFLSLDNPKKVNPHDLLVWKKAGIQEGVFKKLRLGKYEIDARLDLHMKSAREARQDIFQFINDCQKMELRTVLIVHGKGDNSRSPVKLKSYILTWLPQFESVLALHSAQREHGGSGATYVLLRKSEREKQENRERHARKQP